MNPIRLLSLWIAAIGVAAAAQQGSSVSTPLILSGGLVFGTPLSFQSKVTPASGTAVPTGTITFTVDTTAGAPQPLDSSGAATLTLSLSAGPHSISANYDGDTGFLPSASGALNFTLEKATSWVNMSSNAAQLNQPLSIRAAPTIMAAGTVPPGGTVDFYIGGVLIAGCGGVPVQNGVAICNTSVATVGLFSVAAHYSGDSNVQGSDGIWPLTVGKVLAGTYVAAAPDAPVYGTPITFNALLLGAPNVAAPSGSITFSVGGVTSAPVAVGADGRASLVFPSSPNLLAAGSYPVTASYSGDDRYQSSSSATLNFSVAKAATTLVLSSTTPQMGQTVTLKATVTVAGSNPSAVAGGSVTMSNSGLIVCTGVALQAGIATCTLKLVQGGTYSINAAYTGDGNTAPSNATLPLTVSKVAAAISAGFTPSSPVFGAPITVTASLTGVDGQPSPTGAVAFSDATTTLPTIAVGSDGRASMVTSAPLGVGQHDIVATYSGDAAYLSGTATVRVMVGKAPTSVALTSNTVQPGQPVTIRAAVTVVSPGSATPGGLLDFSYAGSGLTGCTGVSLVNGAASCTTTFTQPGSYSITAAYCGDGNTLPASSTLALSFGKTTSNLYTSISTNTAVFGAPVTVNAQVVGATGQAVPTGTVAFSDGAVSLATVTLGSDGRVSLIVPGSAVSSLNAGLHAIGAIYSGDANYQPATAAAVSLMVGKAATSVALSSSSPQSGQAVIIRAAVTIVSPGSGTPAGSVDFSLGGAPIAACTGVALQNGAAICTVALPQAGDNAIAATYGGDSNTSASAATLTVTAGKLAAGISMATPLATPVFGAAVTVTASLQFAGQATPTGTVAFSDGTTSLASVAVAADGRAALVFPSGTLGPLSVGTHSISAVYSGDANYQPATAAALSVTVGKAATAVALTSNPLQSGQPLNLKAVVSIVSPGSATPSGAVDFANGASAIAGCSAIPVQNGTALCTTTFSQSGDYAIKAVYSGDGNTLPASGTLSLSLGKPVPGFTTAASLATPVYGA
ncbi:MAG TPA: Ig-like domain-containing protein, partial [Bryobacteraceae bacterium]